MQDKVTTVTTTSMIQVIIIRGYSLRLHHALIARPKVGKGPVIQSVLVAGEKMRFFHDALREICRISIGTCGTDGQGVDSNVHPVAEVGTCGD